MRIQYLDALKGFAIVLVVLGHAIAWNFSDWRTVVEIAPGMSANVLNTGIIWNLIYSFHMALFFMISGFFCYRSDIRSSWGGQFFKKSRRLLLPYFCSGFLLLFLRGYYGYWFLFSLWELSVLSYGLALITSHINKNDRMFIDCISILVLFVICKAIFNLPILSNPVCDIGKGVNYMIPFFFGWLMKKYPSFLKLTEGHFDIYFILFVTLFISKYYIQGDGIIRIFTTLRFYILPILGSLMCWELFRSGLPQNIESKFSYLGKYTLEIYILHLFFVIQLPQVGDYIMSLNAPTSWTLQLLYSLIVSIVAIALSLLSSFIIHKASKVSIFLFGT